jgi:hypothetical protein
MEHWSTLVPPGYYFIILTLAMGFLPLGMALRHDTRMSIRAIEGRLRAFGGTADSLNSSDIQVLGDLESTYFLATVIETFGVGYIVALLLLLSFFAAGGVHAADVRELTAVQRALYDSSGAVFVAATANILAAYLLHRLSQGRLTGTAELALAIRYMPCRKALMVCALVSGLAGLGSLWLSFAYPLYSVLPGVTLLLWGGALGIKTVWWH